jgi:pimeloyl-ACP methyl ester carboxylesterase
LGNAAIVIDLAIWFAVALAALAVIFVLGHVISWFFYIPLASRVLQETPWLLVEPRRPIWDGEEHEFFAADGTRLQGVYLPTRSEMRKGVVVFCHELHADRWSAGPYTEGLRRHGFDVFTFDFRNHGASERVEGYRPLPWVTEFECEDVRAAIHFVCSRSDADPRGVGLFGVSRGGTAAICAAADDPRVRAVIADGVCPTERLQVHYMRKFMAHWVRWHWVFALLPDMSFRLIGALARRSAASQHNCRFMNVDRIARRLTQPVMLIHGKRDPFVPVKLVRAMAITIPRLSRFWVVPEAKHNGAIRVAGKKYRRRVRRFLERHLQEFAPPRATSTKSSAIEV